MFIRMCWGVKVARAPAERGQYGPLPPTEKSENNKESKNLKKYILILLNNVPVMPNSPSLGKNLAGAPVK